MFLLLDFFFSLFGSEVERKFLWGNCWIFWDSFLWWRFRVVGYVWRGCWIWGKNDWRSWNRMFVLGKIYLGGWICCVVWYLNFFYYKVYDFWVFLLK